MTRMIQNILQFSKWKAIKDEDIKLAVLPWGATEAHNLHLPYGTDTILSEYIAAQAVQKVASDNNKNQNPIGVKGPKVPGMTVLPSIAYGVNTGQMDVKLCMNLNPSTQLAILSDILQVLQRHNIKRLVIINGHGGNLFQPIIRELSLKYPEILVTTINWWVVCKGDNYFKEQGDHAGELETACMMAIHPELVLPLNEAGKGNEKKLKIKGFREKWAWTPRRWIYASSDTGIGNPEAADPAIGKKFLEDVIAKIAEFLKEYSVIEKEQDLYES